MLRVSKLYDLLRIDELDQEEMIGLFEVGAELRKKNWRGWISSA